MEVGNATLAGSGVGGFGLPREAGVQGGLQEGLLIGVAFLLECLALELLSLDTVAGLLRKHGGRELYLKGISYNLVNMLLITPLMYLISEPFNGPAYQPAVVVASKVFLGLFIHSIWYYLAHRAMHTRPLYWMHAFHHKYNTHITPAAANAVTPAEYFFAYSLPFVVGAAMLHPERKTKWIVATALSLTNLCIHMPAMEKVHAQWLPSWLVSATFHADHHRKLVMNYAAPTLNWDGVVQAVPPLNVALARLFGKGYKAKE